MELSEATRAKIAAADARLNKRAGWDANPIQHHIDTLTVRGCVEVGWRESCGKTDATVFVHREWLKVVAALRKQGIIITEHPQKHGNAWATMGNGFWNSVIYTKVVSNDNA